jgi:hypothetical protein
MPRYPPESEKLQSTIIRINYTIRINTYVKFTNAKDKRIGPKTLITGTDCIYFFGFTLVEISRVPGIGLSESEPTLIENG